MKKIILATSNLGKVRELNSMLEGQYNVVSQMDMKVAEVPETGASFIAVSYTHLTLPTKA